MPCSQVLTWIQVLCSSKFLHIYFLAWFEPFCPNSMYFLKVVSNLLQLFHCWVRYLDSIIIMIKIPHDCCITATTCLSFIQSYVKPFSAYCLSFIILFLPQFIHTAVSAFGAMDGSTSDNPWCDPFIFGGDLVLQGIVVYFNVYIRVATDHSGGCLYPNNRHTKILVTCPQHLITVTALILFRCNYGFPCKK